MDVYAVESGYERTKVLSGASSFITHLDWSSDSLYIQVNTGDSQRLIYNVLGNTLSQYSQGDVSRS